MIPAASRLMRSTSRWSSTTASSRPCSSIDRKAAWRACSSRSAVTIAVCLTQPAASRNCCWANLAPSATIRASNSRPGSSTRAVLSGDAPGLQVLGGPEHLAGRDALDAVRGLERAGPPAPDARHADRERHARRRPRGRKRGQCPPPNTASTGLPTAAATCIGPVSWPTYPADRCDSAMSWSSVDPCSIQIAVCPACWPMHAANLDRDGPLFRQPDEEEPPVAPEGPFAEHQRPVRRAATP